MAEVAVEGGEKGPVREVSMVEIVCHGEGLSGVSPPRRAAIGPIVQRSELWRGLMRGMMTSGSHTLQHRRGSRPKVRRGSAGGSGTSSSCQRCCTHSSSSRSCESCIGFRGLGFPPLGFRPRFGPRTRTRSTQVAQVWVVAMQLLRLSCGDASSREGCVSAWGGLGRQYCGLRATSLRTPGAWNSLLPSTLWSSIAAHRH